MGALDRLGYWSLTWVTPGVDADQLLSTLDGDDCSWLDWGVCCGGVDLVWLAHVALSGGADRVLHDSAEKSLVTNWAALRIDPSWWDELRHAVGGDPGEPLVARPVTVRLDQSMVVVAQQGQIRQVSAPPVSPWLDVMRFTRGGMGLASGKHAAAVAQDQGGADATGHQALRPADIEDFGGPPEDGRDHVRVTAQPSQVAGADLLAGGNGTGIDCPLMEGDVVHGDHNPWAIAPT